MKKEIKVSDILNIEGISKEDKIALIALWLSPGFPFNFEIQQPKRKWWQFWK